MKRVQPPCGLSRFLWRGLAMLLGGCWALTAPAQTLHVLIFADTNDPTAGASNQKTEVYLSNDLAPAIARLCGYQLRRSVFTGEQCRAAVLDTELTALSPAPNDVVLFYFVGHGWNNRQNDWPSLILGNANTDRATLETASRNLLDVYDRLRVKNARLTLVVGEACNKERSDAAPKALVSRRDPIPLRTTAYQTERFRQLFGGVRGGVLLASSQRGQLSNCDAKGGLLSVALQNAIRQGLNEGTKGAASWPALLADVTKQTEQAAAALGVGQKPMHRLDVQRVEPGGHVPPPPGPAPDRLEHCPPVETYINETALAGIRDDLPLLRQMSERIDSDNAEQYAAEFLRFYANQKGFYANLNQMLFYESARMPDRCRPDFNRNVGWVRESTADINRRYALIHKFAQKPLLLAAQARSELPSLITYLEDMLAKFDKQ